jgi:hypothetical protein
MYSLLQTSRETMFQVVQFKFAVIACEFFLKLMIETLGQENLKLVENQFNKLQVTSKHRECNKMKNHVVR